MHALRAPLRRGSLLELLRVTLRGVSGADKVVKVTVFLTDVNDRRKINPARVRYFGENRPASTLVEVSALVLPSLKVEIEAVAVAG